MNWWTIVFGSGFVWTVEQMGEPTARLVREDNLNTLRTQAATFIETNAIYAVARKPLRRYFAPIRFSEVQGRRTRYPAGDRAQGLNLEAGP